MITDISTILKEISEEAETLRVYSNADYSLSFGEQNELDKLLPDKREERMNKFERDAKERRKERMYTLYLSMENKIRSADIPDEIKSQLLSLLSDFKDNGLTMTPQDFDKAKKVIEEAQVDAKKQEEKQDTNSKKWSLDESTQIVDAGVVARMPVLALGAVALGVSTTSWTRPNYTLEQITDMTVNVATRSVNKALSRAELAKQEDAQKTPAQLQADQDARDLKEKQLTVRSHNVEESGAQKEAKAEFVRQVQEKAAASGLQLSQDEILRSATPMEMKVFEKKDRMDRPQVYAQIAQVEKKEYDAGIQKSIEHHIQNKATAMVDEMLKRQKAQKREKQEARGRLSEEDKAILKEKTAKKNALEERVVEKYIQNARARNPDMSQEELMASLPPAVLRAKQRIEERTHPKTRAENKKAYALERKRLIAYVASQLRKDADAPHSHLRETLREHQIEISSLKHTLSQAQRPDIQARKKHLAQRAAAHKKANRSNHGLKLRRLIAQNVHAHVA